MDRRDTLKFMGCAVLGSSPVRTLAESPKPVLRIVVPYPAGGQSDVLGRLVASSMQRTLDRPVIIENRPGAAGLIGIRQVQTAAPDGDLILFHNSGMVALTLLQKGVNYDAQKDFEPIAMTGIGPAFLMVHESVPARTLPEFLAYARTQPRGIECANSGINTPGQIAALMLEKLAGIKLLHVPYKGSAESASAIVSGQVKMQVSVTTEFLNPHIEAGRIRVLGVATTDRTSLAPEIPRIGELVPGYGIDGWFGFLAPAHTPPAKTEALSQAIKLALEEPLVRERFTRLYMEVAYRTPKEFSSVISTSVSNWRSIVKTLQLAPQ